ncbi:hypothetical protein HF086_010152 [Spodoptera exigua]|uniref:Uncharacterized protein n=1 Tax=Spodoptera exigua TaxID=7107 RepID=A0A922SQ73_SPOEX|nr:hypothetical protein HF086_010152 [Spodoptera exigua]
MRRTSAVHSKTGSDGREGTAQVYRRRRPLEADTSRMRGRSEASGGGYKLERARGAVVVPAGGPGRAEHAPPVAARRARPTAHHSDRGGQLPGDHGPRAHRARAQGLPHTVDYYENTRSKFLFYGGKDYLQPGGLLDYIPKELIPDFLGGPCKSFVHEGGLVPKSLYVSGAFTEREGDPLSEDSIYRSVSLGKGQLLITALCVGGGDEAKSVLDQKGWREGEHFHRVEPTLVCHDGESIQGFHVQPAVGYERVLLPQRQVSEQQLPVPVM